MAKTRKPTYAFDSRIGRTELWTSVILGMIVLVVYSLTLCPGIGGGDSADFIASVRYNAVAHPPGYPLYTVLGKLFALLPFGDFEWRINFSSAFLSAASISFLCLTVSVWLKCLPAAIFAGGLVAFSPLVWRYSLSAEVFSLNNFFVTGFLFLALSYHRTKNKRLLLAGAFTCGLAMSNHHTFVFLMLPYVAWLLLFERQKSLILGFKLIGLFVLGLTPYIYIYWAGLEEHLLSWGDTGNWQGFLNHLLRKDYGTFRLGAEVRESQFWKAAGQFFYHFWNDTLLVGCLLSLVGLWSHFKDNFTRLSTVAVILYLAVFFIGGNLNLSSDLHRQIFSRFFQFPLFFVGIWASAGFKYLAFDKFKLSSKLIWVFAILLPLVQVVVNYKSEDQSNNKLVEQFAISSLKFFPQQSVFLSRGDIVSFNLPYLQLSRDFRRDIQVLPIERLKQQWMRKFAEKHLPNVNLPNGLYTRDYKLRNLLETNSHIQDFFIIGLSQHERKQIESRYQILPIAYFFWIRKKENPVPLRDFIGKAAEFDSELEQLFTPPYTKGSWEYEIWEKYWLIKGLSLGYILPKVLLGGGEIEKILAAELTIDVIEKHPGLAAGLYKNAGILFQQLGGSNPRYRKALVTSWSKYLQTPEGQSDQEREKIESYLRNF